MTINIINQDLGYRVRGGNPDAVDSITPMTFGTLALDLQLKACTAGGTHETARRETRSHGWILRKSRARHWEYTDQLGNCIYDPWKKALVIGGNFELTLEDVEKFLEENPYMT